MASLIRKAFNHTLVLTTQGNKRGADRETIGHSSPLPLEPLDPDLGGERNAAEIESESAARGELDGVGAFEQHTAQADIKKAYRDRKSQDREFRFGDHGARDSTTIGRASVLHGLPQCKEVANYADQ